MRYVLHIIAPLHPSAAWPSYAIASLTECNTLVDPLYGATTMLFEVVVEEVHLDHITQIMTKNGCQVSVIGTTNPPEPGLGNQFVSETQAWNVLQEKYGSRWDAKYTPEEAADMLCIRYPLDQRSTYRPDTPQALEQAHSNLLMFHALVADLKALGEDHYRKVVNIIRDRLGLYPVDRQGNQIYTIESLDLYEQQNNNAGNNAVSDRQRCNLWRSDKEI